MKKIIVSICAMLMYASAAIATPIIHKVVDNPTTQVYLSYSKDNNTTMLFISGEIKAGLDNLVTDILATHPEVSSVALSGPGGDANEGYRLGIILGENKMPVRVPFGAYCLSACANAFLGGTDYQIYGILGFHNAYIMPDQMVNMSSWQLIQAGRSLLLQQTQYYLDNQLSFEFCYDVEQFTTPDKLFVFTNGQQLMQYVVGNSRDEMLNHRADWYMIMDGQQMMETLDSIRKNRPTDGLFSYKPTEIWEL